MTVPDVCDAMVGQCAVLTMAEQGRNGLPQPLSCSLKLVAEREWRADRRRTDSPRSDGAEPLAKQNR
jgi:hypothetical protein